MVPGPFMIRGCVPLGTMVDEISRSTPLLVLPAPILKVVGSCKLILAALIVAVVPVALVVIVAAPLPLPKSE